jgi:hypothetical protein
VLARYGLQFDRCDRFGFTRLTVSGVKLETDAVNVRAERVETIQPLTWLWRRAWPGAAGETDQPELAASGWTVESKPRQRPGRPGSTVRILNQVEPVLGQLAGWVKSIDLENGTVVTPALTFRVPAAQMRGERLMIRVAEKRLPGPVELRIESVPDSLYVLRLSSPAVVCRS